MQGKIILQSFESRAYEDGKVLRLKYDLLNAKYVPGDGAAYDEKELGS